MRITFSDAGKRFNREWIFRNFNKDFLTAERYAITGPNGSGKSTLLQVIGGSMAISAGKVSWKANEVETDPEMVYQSIAIAAPYLETIEEFTATEFLDFHSKFKPFIKDITIAAIIEMIGLKKAADKQIRYYSSGMKQRLKLAQAIFSDVPLLLLDEPCTNLDLAGIELYHHLVNHYATGKTIIVSSNDTTEYSFCNHIINITDFK